MKMKNISSRSENGQNRRIPTRRLLILVLTLLAVSAAVLLVSACVGVSADITGAVGQPMVLEPGQKAVLSDPAIAIRFLKVVNDSRCPTGAQCIWAGQVTAQAEITYQGEKFDVVLTQSANSDAKTTFADFTIAFSVEPYPELEKKIDSKDYRLNLTLSREPSLSGGILATFRVVEEQYSIFVTNEEAIEQIFALQRGESTANIPIGRIVRGAVSYNKPWSAKLIDIKDFR
jgi:hypothetical protein